MSREEMDALAKGRLVGIAREWYDQMRDGIVPFVRLPTRTKQNIEYDDESEVWKYGDKESTRAATTEKSAVHLLKMAYVIGFLKQQLVENRSSTLRELYYISEGWRRAKFSAQDESNLLIEDLEIITDVQREAFHLRPEEDGASIFGPLRIRETTRLGMNFLELRSAARLTLARQPLEPAGRMRRRSHQLACVRNQSLARVRWILIEQHHHPPIR